MKEAQKKSSIKAEDIPTLIDMLDIGNYNDRKNTLINAHIKELSESVVNLAMLKPCIDSEKEYVQDLLDVAQKHVVSILTTLILIEREYLELFKGEVGE